MDDEEDVPELQRAREFEFDQEIDDEDARLDDEDARLDHEDYGIPAPEECTAEPPLWDLEEDLDPGHNSDDPDGPDDLEVDFAAFDEPDLFRNAYVDACVQKTLYRVTRKALKHLLKAARQSLSAHPNIPPDDIVKIAQTIETAEKRLGISTADIITTYPLCPVCKRRYDPAYIATAAQNACLKAECTSILFTNKVLTSHKRRRVSSLTSPVASLISWLQRIFSQPGMAELMQNWRDGPIAVLDDRQEGIGHVFTTLTRQ